MIDFSTLTGLTTPRGAVTQIADVNGNVLWAMSGGKVVLEVEKITSDTYAGETAYTGEQFVLLDIYPKTNGTVKVTYGGLTKTITDTSGAEEPNAQQVFFGTFNGVSDSVSTPASGELTIEGGYASFGVGVYARDSKVVALSCNCITGLIEWGGITSIVDSAFSGCTAITDVDLSGITTIGNNAFSNCTGLTEVAFSDSVTTIGNSAFKDCSAYTLTFLPSSLTHIGERAFMGCGKITLTSLPSGLTYFGDSAFANSSSTSEEVSLSFTSLPSGLTYLGDYACYGNNALPSSLVLPNSLAVIGERCFSYNQAMKKVVIGDNVTTIKEEAFDGCRHLTDITIGRNITEIGRSAFDYGTGSGELTRQITILATIPPTLGSADALGEVVAATGINYYLTITVPAGSADAYKASENWSTYADYIVEAS